MSSALSSRKTDRIPIRYVLELINYFHRASPARRYKYKGGYVQVALVVCWSRISRSVRKATSFDDLGEARTRC